MPAPSASPGNAWPQGLFSSGCARHASARANGFRFVDDGGIFAKGETSSSVRVGDRDVRRGVPRSRRTMSDDDDE